MASHGFVVVSSSFNLPSDGKWTEMTSSNYENYNENSEIAFVLRFCKNLPMVDTTRMVAVGHSWGAQSEIIYDNWETEKSFKRIIGLHTTMEDNSIDSAKEEYPYFNYLFENKCENSTTPVTIFAPLNVVSSYYTDIKTGEEVLFKSDTLKPLFDPFRINKTTPYTFVTTNYNLKHDAFVTIGNLAYPFISKFQFSNYDNIIKQQFYYEQIIILSEKIISSTLNNTFNHQNLVNKHFMVERIN
jgi:hypothetical protein